ncbi:CAP domain-containing protein [Microcoleus sp. ARI1-B5]|uniref:CAP domain-containing protein n=1 Tax=unclassified Microcoleus TaxID=2642155 RepID=UPI002FD2BF97
MTKLSKGTSLLTATGIGLALTTLSIGLTLNLTPASAKTQKMSDDSKIVAQKVSLNQAEILTAHNQYRQEVKVSAIKWSSSLAASAQQWANNLASTRSFQHSKSQGKYGENIWRGTSGAYSQTKMVDSWGSEKQYFIANQAFPNTCKGGWQKCGHYTQIIWKNTTEVGCGIASGGGNDYFVCQYNPPGNYQGQKPY